MTRKKRRRGEIDSTKFGTGGKISIPEKDQKGKEDK